jgi:hypothetical protein
MKKHVTKPRAKLRVGRSCAGSGRLAGGRMKQKYPYWRQLDKGNPNNRAYYTQPRRYVATCMRSYAYGHWFVPHLDLAGPFSKLEDAKRVVEAGWGPAGVLSGSK